MGANSLPAAAGPSTHRSRLVEFIDQLADRGVTLSRVERDAGPAIRVTGARNLRRADRAKIERQRDAILAHLAGEPEKEDQTSQATAGSVAEPPAGEEVPASNGKDAEEPLRQPRQVLLTDRQTGHPRPGAGRPTLARPFTADATRNLRDRLMFAGAFGEQIYAARERRGG